jgi:DegT/DnrJ/EryC1/StrS aminotransferase family
METLTGLPSAADPALPRRSRNLPVLAVPTLWPRHLVPRLGGVRAFPFSAPTLQPFYLARNAIWHAVQVLGLAGHEVIVPAYHHGVEIAALLDAGAHVRYARVDSRLQLDLEDVEAKIGAHTRGIYVIHYAGFPQPIQELRALCQRHGLLLLEDCALSLFSQHRGRPLGTWGDVAFFCFYKTLPLSHGGALLFANPPPVRFDSPAPPLRSTLSKTVSSLLVTAELRGGRWGATTRRLARATFSQTRQWARSVEVPVGTQDFDRNVVNVGMSRVTRLLAGSSDAHDVVQRRRENWLLLHHALSPTGRAVWSELPEGVCPLFYGVRVRSKDRALAHLRAAGIQAIDFWRFGHQTLPRDAFPEVEALRQSVVELPCHQDVTRPELARVIEAARTAVEL